MSPFSQRRMPKLKGGKQSFGLTDIEPHASDSLAAEC
jgi:hypothetical protein